MVNPFALELLQKNRITIDGLRSKNWNEFSKPGAPRMDFIFTVCDNAAGEACPVWPGHPITGHWSVPDPAAVQGSDDEKRKAFQGAFTHLTTRIRLFVSLPLEKLEQTALKRKLDEIGHT